MSRCKPDALLLPAADRMTNPCVVRASIPSVDVPFLTSDCSSVQDDELLAWLQHPADDTVDRGYCTGNFGDVGGQHVRHVKDPFVQETIGGVEKLRGVVSDEVESGVEAANTDQAATMVTGVGRAVAVLVGSSMDGDTPPLGPKITDHHAGQIRMFGTPSSLKQILNYKETADPHSPFLIDTYVQKLSSPNFVVPVSHCKSSLQVIGAFSGPTNNNRLRQHCAVESCQPSTAECIPGVSHRVSSQCCVERLEVQQGSSDVIREPGIVPSMCSNGENTYPEVSLHHSLKTASEMVIHRPDTIPSPSLSASIIDKPSSNDIPHSKRKVDIEVPDNQSEECDEARSVQKSPAGRSSATKRSRAAETHNESEKRRRNRINMRMKALQELVPNSTKTDKASMLDEVIEYMKTLKAQLEFMCMRTGMLIPPVPSGMQCLPAQHVATVSPVAMEFGLGMGVGLGVGMDMNMGVGFTNVSSVGANLSSITGHAPFLLPPSASQPLSLPSCRVAQLPVPEMKPGRSNPPPIFTTELCKLSSAPEPAQDAVHF